jgi:hypothetical protein
MIRLDFGFQVLGCKPIEFQVEPNSLGEYQTPDKNSTEAQKEV